MLQKSRFSFRSMIKEEKKKARDDSVEERHKEVTLERMQKWTRCKEVKTNCPKGVQKVPRWAYGSHSDNSSKSGVPRWCYISNIIYVFCPTWHIITPSPSNHALCLHHNHPLPSASRHFCKGGTCRILLHSHSVIVWPRSRCVLLRLLPLSICLFVQRALHWNLSCAPFLHLCWLSDFCVGETYARAPCLAYGFLSSRLLFFHPSICSCCSLSFVCYMTVLFRACVSHFTAYVHKWLPAAQVSCSRLYRFLPFIDKQAPASVNVDSSSARREHRYTPGNAWKHDLASFWANLQCKLVVCYIPE